MNRPALGGALLGHVLAGLGLVLPTALGPRPGWLLLLHALASLACAALLLRSLPAALQQEQGADLHDPHDNPDPHDAPPQANCWRHRASLALLFAIPLTIPLCGALGLCAALSLGLRGARRTDDVALRLTPVPPLPYRPHAIAERPAYDVGALSSTLRACTDVERRLRAVLAARALREPQEVAILQLALRDPVDDVRLLAYSLLDRREQALNQMIQSLQRALEGAGQGTAQLGPRRRLAQASYELVRLGLARGEVQTFLLEAARDHLKAVLSQAPRDRESHLLLGEVYLRLRKPRQAEAVLKDAAALGLAAEALIEARVEAALRKRRLAEARALLGSLADDALRARPLLRALSRSLLAGHRRVPALRRSTRASLLRSTGAGWDVGP